MMYMHLSRLIGVERIRCFDLGGNGLKTALIFYDDSQHAMRFVSPVVQLGKCPNKMRVSKWVRKQMRHLAHVDLDAEIKSGYLFSFALASINKLREKSIKISSIPKLFQLPSHAITTLNDGNAHLLASLKTLENQLPDGVIWNFSLGTGVGFGFTNSQQEIRPIDDLVRFFHQDACSVKEPLTQREIWEAGGGKGGFDQIVAQQQNEAFTIFASRWKAFIEREIICRAQHSDINWGVPTAVIFTGGHIEYHGDRLIKELRAQGIEVPVFTGPHHAGLLGAAWYAVQPF